MTIHGKIICKYCDAYVNVRWWKSGMYADCTNCDAVFTKKELDCLSWRIGSKAKFLYKPYGNKKPFDVVVTITRTGSDKVRISFPVKGSGRERALWVKPEELKEYVS